MIARISDEDLAEIRANVRFVEVLSEYTTLNPAHGEYLLGVCPRCLELALEVATLRMVWHCHTCNIGGDAINFVQIAADTTFPKAVRRVCELSGLPEPKFELISVLPHERV